MTTEVPSSGVRRRSRSDPVLGRVPPPAGQDAAPRFLGERLRSLQAHTLARGFPCLDGGADYASIDTPAKKIVRLRSRSISKLVSETASTIEWRFDAVLHGHHDGNILFAGPPAAALAQIEDVSRREIYASSRRIRADLQAHKVISTLLEAYLGAFLEREMVGRPSGSGSDILTTFPHAEGAPLDKPSYVRATLDYVSGMTDRFAINCAKFLAGAASG